MFSYPLIFLAKIANEGLLGPNLDLSPPDRPAVPLSPMSPSDKLCRLLQLGADFLDTLAPNPAHPAVKQATFLRRIRDAGIGGRRSVISAPGSPRAGAATLQQPKGGMAGLPTMAHGHVAANPAALVHGGANGSSSSNGQQTTTTANATAAAHASMNGTGPSAMITAPLGDFSLASSYQPSPAQSPRHQSQQLVDDPFSALLSGVSPSFFDGSGGAEGLFGMPGFDAGFENMRWEDDYMG